MGVPIAIVATVLGAYLTSRAVARQFDVTIEASLAEAASRASNLVAAYMHERRSDVRNLARLPSTVEDTKTAGERSQLLGLDRIPLTDVEERLAGERRLATDQLLPAFLQQFADSSDFREITVVERHGFAVIQTNPDAQLVQSDEQWWLEVGRSGNYEAAPRYDRSSASVHVVLATSVSDPETGNLIGAVRAILDLSPLASLMGSDNQATGSSIAIVDSLRRVIVSTYPGAAFGSVVARSEPDRGGISLLGTGSGGGRIVSVAIGGEPWSVTVERTREVEQVAARSVRDSVFLTAGAALLVAVVLIAWLTDWLHRRVTKPVRWAGIVAARVADGDLTVSPQSSSAGAQEVNKLLDAVNGMVAALRRLVGEIRSSSHESAAMAQEISASTEEMSASTQQMADTCQDLSQQATVQAELARRSADDANRILAISSTLADGSSVAAQRSSAINQTADEHRRRLMDGSAKLAELANDLERGAADAEQLSDLSEQVQQFVTQAKSIATQTNMLALNAAIEASRVSHGEERGFAVVADEVRKLASQAARSATGTSQIVRSVQTTVQETRERLTRLAAASSAVREVAESAAQALEEVAGATAESSAWSEEISRAAADVKQLVQEITGRLESIALGTESIVAASEQIAASAEQQSASTEEIAGSAAQLASVSDHLTSTVNSFRLATQSSTDRQTPHGRQRSD